MARNFLKRFLSDRRLIRSSGIFHRSWYRASHREMISPWIDTLSHYVLVGGQQGLSPHPLFDGGWYLRRYTDVAETELNPLVHYLKLGAAEGRDPHPLFDTDWYLKQYRDVAAAGINPLSHYIRFGAAEGRDPSPTFQSDLWNKEREQAAKTDSLGLIDFVLHGWGRAKRLSPNSFDRHELPFRANSGSRPGVNVVPSASGSNPKQSLPPATFLCGGREAWDRQGKIRLHEILHAGRRVRLDHNPAPEVSLIVVLFGNAHLTALCIDAIIANCDRPYEVVLVNNGSDKESLQLLDHLEGAHILRNIENVGFSKACMQGVAQARGKYLCFLNNDALLQPRSVSSAIENFERDRTVGAVGGKIIFADGGLQEAGSIVWSDGTAWGVGRGEDPTLPQHNFRRPVDYCSGVFLITPRTLFIDIGGFDPIYQPAYYEDSDYCLSLSVAGYKILYEPAAVVAHYESASSSNVDDAKPLIEENRLRFVRKWGARLTHQYFRISENMPSARVCVRAGSLLILYVASEQTPGCAPADRAKELLATLVAQGHQVTCIVSRDSESDWKVLLPDEVEVVGHRKDFLDEVLERYPHYDVIWWTRAEGLPSLLRFGRGGGLLRPQLIFDPWTSTNPRCNATTNGESLIPHIGTSRLDPITLQAARDSDLVIARSRNELAYLSSCGFRNIKALFDSDLDE